MAHASEKTDTAGFRSAHIPQNHGPETINHSTTVMTRFIFLSIYYGIAYHLPGSYAPVIGRLCNSLRIWCVRHIFRQCGKVSTIDRHAYFGNGTDLVIGDFSGIGADCVVPRNTIIGKYVMMAPEVHIVTNNHRFADTGTPMCMQGPEPSGPTIIEDDCWIGVRSILTQGTPHRHRQHSSRRIGRDSRRRALQHRRRQSGPTYPQTQITQRHVTIRLSHAILQE